LLELLILSMSSVGQDGCKKSYVLMAAGAKRR